MPVHLRITKPSISGDSKQAKDDQYLPSLSDLIFKANVSDKKAHVTDC